MDVRDSSKGPILVEMLKTRVKTRHDKRQESPDDEVLVVIRYRVGLNDYLLLFVRLFAIMTCDIFLGGCDVVSDQIWVQFELREGVTGKLGSEKLQFPVLRWMDRNSDFIR